MLPSQRQRTEASSRIRETLEDVMLNTVMGLIWKQNGLKNVMGMIVKTGGIVSMVNFLNSTMVPCYTSLKSLFILKKYLYCGYVRKCALLKDTLASHGSLVKIPPANAGDLGSVPERRILNH